LAYQGTSGKVGGGFWFGFQSQTMLVKARLWVLGEGSRSKMGRTIKVSNNMVLNIDFII